MSAPNGGDPFHENLEVLPVLDDPPKSGYFAPEISELEMTDEEITAGNEMGASIDIDDDEDNGGVA